MNTRKTAPPHLIGMVAGVLATLLCASALAPLFEGFGWWFGPVLVATTVAVGGAALARALRLALPLVVPLTALGLIVTVTALCASSTAVAGLVPTGRTVSELRSLLAIGQQDVSRLAAPVPQRPGLILLIVIGTYVIATAVDFLVVTLRRPTLAGIPLLAMFMLPAAVLPRAIGPVPFLLGASGFLLLLLVDRKEATRRWGKSISQPGRSSRWIASARLTGSIGICALVCALALPSLLPPLDGVGYFRERSTEENRNGEGPRSAIVMQPIVSLDQQLQSNQIVELLSVRTTNPQYLRLTAVEQFDGHRFTLRPLRAVRDAGIDNGLPRPDSSVRTNAVTATIQVSENLAERYLPLPGIPTRVEGLDGDWRLAAETGTVFTTRTSTAGATYQVSTVVPVPPPGQPPAPSREIPADLKIDTEVPATTDPAIALLARNLTRNITDPYQQAIAIQKYLRGSDFTYDLNGAPTTQDGALSEFLFRTKRGYCQQFASAMTVLLRMIGIPARVAIGFMPGTLQADGTYLITNKDAHAWPEAWFPSAGWVSFEPTPRSDAAITTPAYVLPEPTSQADPSASQAPLAEPTAGTTEPDQTGEEMSGDPRIAGDVTPRWILWVLLGLGVLAVLATPATVRATRRRRRLRIWSSSETTGNPEEGSSPRRRHGRPGRRPEPVSSTTLGDRRTTNTAAMADAREIDAMNGHVHAVWAELIDLATDLGVPLRPSESPRATVARLAAYVAAGTEVDDQDAETARAALNRVCDAEEHARYAPRTLARPGAAEETIGHDLHIVTRLLRKATPRTERALALVAPRSVVTALGGMRGADPAL